ncbi:MAG: hypothetical protein K1X79_14075 [Oligoflexia bacterium]|nr:hypothetical protein [Oligoflexia bacterium]
MKLAICTTTLYRTERRDEKIRWECARQFIQSCKNSEYTIYAIDGGSSHEVLDFLSCSGVSVFRQRGMTLGMARRQAILEAYKSAAPYILYTELEKYPLAPFIHDIVQLLEKGVAQLVVPERETLTSLPHEQYNAEVEGNDFFANLTGRPIDVWFGPRAWARPISRYFLNYQGEYGDTWESIFVPLLRAIKDGIPTHGLPLAYTHPQPQTAHEEGNAFYVHKRRKQLHVIREALLQTWNEQTQPTLNYYINM